MIRSEMQSNRKIDWQVYRIRSGPLLDFSSECGALPRLPKHHNSAYSNDVVQFNQFLGSVLVWDFSVQPLCSLCLCGSLAEKITTEAQRTQRLHREEIQLKTSPDATKRHKRHKRQ